MAEQVASDVKEEAVGQVTTDTAPSPVETAEPALEGEELLDDPTADKEIAEDLAKEAKDKEPTPGEDEPSDDDDEDPKDEDPDKGEDEPDKDPEEPKKGAEARKEQLQTEIRQLVAKRNELRAEVTDVNSKVYAPQSPEELVDQGMDPAMARVEALEQRTQMAEFNAHVADLNANLNIEALQVMADYPVFNPDAPEYDKALADKARQVYEKAAAVQTDPNTGLIIQANALPYEIYKAFAEAAQSGTQRGAINGQIAAEKNLAAADPVPTSAPKAAPEDPFLKGLMSSDD